MRRAPLPKPLQDAEIKLFDFITGSVKHLDVTLRIAGGWVRDKMLGKPADDIDITIETPQGRPHISGEQLAHVLSNATKDANHPHVAVIKTNPEKSKHIETAVITIMGYQLELCHLRKDDYTSCSSVTRTPTVTVATPLEDAQRRDFCCNALFYNLKTREVEDYVGGIEDIQKGVLRCPLDPHETFTDDPLRMLRGLRFSGKLGFRIDPSVTETILRGGEVHEPGFFTHEWKNVSLKPLVWELLRKVSRERYGIECNKMFSGPRPVMCFDNLASHGLLYSAVLLEMIPVKSKRGATADYDRIGMICPRSMWDELYRTHTAPVLRIAFATDNISASKSSSSSATTYLLHQELQQQQSSKYNLGEDKAVASSVSPSRASTSRGDDDDAGARASSSSGSHAATTDNTPSESLLTSPSDRAVVSLFSVLAAPLVLQRDRISADVLGSGRQVPPSQTPFATQQNPIGRTNSAATRAFGLRDEILKRTEAVVQVGLKLPRKLSEEVTTLLLALEVMFMQYDGTKLIQGVIQKSILSSSSSTSISSSLSTTSAVNEDAASSTKNSAVTSVEDFSKIPPINFSEQGGDDLRSAIFHALRGIRNSSLAVVLAFLRVVAAIALTNHSSDDNNNNNVISTDHHHDQQRQHSTAAAVNFFVDSLSSSPQNHSLFRCGSLVPLLKGDELNAKDILPSLPKPKFGDVLTAQLQFMIDHPEAGRDEVVRYLIQQFGNVGVVSNQQQQQDEDQQ